MRHVRLGRTGLRVSRLCLGTMTSGLQCDEAVSYNPLFRQPERELPPLCREEGLG